MAFLGFFKSITKVEDDKWIYSNSIEDDQSAIYTILGDQIVVESISRDADGMLDPRVLDVDGPVYDPATMMALPDNDPFYSIADHKGAIGTTNAVGGVGIK